MVVAHEQRDAAADDAEPRLVLPHHPAEAAAAAAPHGPALPPVATDGQLHLHGKQRLAFFPAAFVRLPKQPAGAAVGLLAR